MSLPPSPRVRWGALAAYVGVVAAATLLQAPVAENLTFAQRVAEFLRPPLRPSALIDAIRNVALFTGWGLLWVLTARDIRASRTLLVGATATGASLSLAVELAQLFFTSRTASLLDVATNTTGAALGVLTTLAFLRLLAVGVGRRSFVGMPAALLAAAYACACAAEAIVPLFRQRMAPGAWGAPGERLATVLVAFRADPSWSLPLGDVPLFLPAGLFTVAALVELGWSYRRSAAVTTVAGVVAAVGLEVAHGMLGIPIRMGAILVHGLAVPAGAALGAVLLPRFSRALRGPERPRALLALYAVVLLAWLTRPYRLDLTPLSLHIKITFPWWLPLGDARFRTDLFGVFDITSGFLLFLPVGALLAVWPLRRRGWAAGIWPVVLFALALEASQFVLYLRLPTITDPLVQSAGAAIGWAAMRRVGFPRYGAALERQPPPTVDATGGSGYRSI
ncbi:MAG: VanZ family protein [Gemmatimonadota bacterium]